MKIRARHKTSLKIVDLDFKSIKQAKYYNPEFEDFVEVKSNV